MGLVLYIDGGSRGNPGPAGGGVVLSGSDGRRIHEGAYYFGSQTNNAAEYMTLLRGIERAARANADSLLIHSDSELLVKQMTGEYRVKSPSLAALHEQAEMALIRVPRWSFKHVRREFNRRADELANIAMDEGEDRILFDADSAPSQVGASPPQGTARSVTRSDSTTGANPSRIETACVQVDMARRPTEGMCPAGNWLEKGMIVGAALPSGTCLHAAHAVVPTLISIQSTLAGEVASLPTMTVRCTKPDCGAIFHISTPAGSNGSGH